MAEWTEYRLGDMSPFYRSGKRGIFLLSVSFYLNSDLISFAYNVFIL